MTTIRLGNPAAATYKQTPPGDDPEREGTLDAPTVTTIRTSKDSTLVQTIDEITRIWAIHSDAEKPSWIDCDNEALTILLTEVWGKLPAEPKRKGGGKVAPLAVLLAIHLLLFRLSLHLRTTVGRDHQAGVSFDTASTGTGIYSPAEFIGVTEDATAPAAGDTTLTTELAVEGFTRAQTVYAHTAATAVVTVTKTFTMSGGTSRTLRHAGLFTLVAVGIMVYKTAIPSAPTLVSGDAVAVTWTFTL